MSRLVPDNTEIILNLAGKEGTYRKPKDKEEFFSLLKTKVLRDFEKVFGDEHIDRKAGYLIDVLNDLEEFKVALEEKMTFPWDETEQKRTEYTGGYANRLILEDTKAVEKQKENNALEWGKGHNFPEMILKRDRNGRVYKKLSAGEEAWTNWIDAYQDNEQNMRELTDEIERKSNEAKNT